MVDCIVPVCNKHDHYRVVMLRFLLSDVPGCLSFPVAVTEGATWLETLCFFAISFFISSLTSCRLLQRTSKCSSHQEWSLLPIKDTLNKMTAPVQQIAMFLCRKCQSYPEETYVHACVTPGLHKNAAFCCSDPWNMCNACRATPSAHTAATRTQHSQPMEHVQCMSCNTHCA